MITEKNHKLLTSQLFVTDCTKKGLASMYIVAICFIGGGIQKKPQTCHKSLSHTLYHVKLNWAHLAMDENIDLTIYNGRCKYSFHMVIAIAATYTVGDDS